MPPKAPSFACLVGYVVFW